MAFPDTVSAAEASRFAEDARIHTFNMAGHTIQSLDTVASFNNGVYSGTTSREDVPLLEQTSVAETPWQRAAPHRAGAEIAEVPAQRTGPGLLSLPLCSGGARKSAILPLLEGRSPRLARHLPRAFATQSATPYS